MTLASRAIGPPSSSVDIQGTIWPCALALASRLAIPELMAGPDPAAGWPNNTNPPTPAAAIGVDAPRSENCPATISSCSTRCETGQALTDGVQAGGPPGRSSTTGP